MNKVLETRVDGHKDVLFNDFPLNDPVHDT